MPGALSNTEAAVSIFISACWQGERRILTGSARFLWWGTVCMGVAVVRWMHSHEQWLLQHRETAANLATFLCGWADSYCSKSQIEFKPEATTLVWSSWCGSHLSHDTQEICMSRKVLDLQGLSKEGKGLFGEIPAQTTSIQGLWMKSVPWCPAHLWFLYHFSTETLVLFFLLGLHRADLVVSCLCEEKVQAQEADLV